MNNSAWTVHKFGGSSLADAARFRRVADIIADLQAGPRAIVVSAVGGVTDELLRLLQLAVRKDPVYRDRLEQIARRHRALADELLGSGQARTEFEQAFSGSCQDIADVLHATALLGSQTPAATDLVAGAGELWSAQLLAGLLSQQGKPVRWLDAARILVIEHSDLGPGVVWDESQARLAAELGPGLADTIVITGFRAVDRDGVQTTLGRDGSDYSASIFGALLKAAEVNIWTDVAGVMSADPRRVADAAIIPRLSYDEAMELAYFGARVLHPQTMGPAVAHDIPIYIRDSAAPTHTGTRISRSGAGGEPVKGITAIDGMALVNVEGAGMIGVPGTAHRVFGALRQAGVSVVLISQGSSEHSICFAVPDSEAHRVRQVISDAFRAELDAGQVQSIQVSPGCAILAVVGDGMAGTPGVAAKFFDSLGRAGINVRAIAQGSSERNISAVIAGADTVRALRAVHSGFYLSPQTLSIGLIGPGTVGSVLLEQIDGQLGRLAESLNLDLRIRAITSSSRMLIDERRIDLRDWRDRMATAGEEADLDKWVASVHAEHIPHAVIIDCTAAQNVADRYPEWLAAGIHVITPNKKANSADIDFYRGLQRSARQGNARLLYETTVGAGLPIIQTLRDLRQTGDRIVRIEGILSGTLAYLFNLYDGQRPFSELVRAAHQQGFTEPDPRDDLSGMDVARKVVILGREMGLDIELSQLQLESLVPAELRQTSVEDFVERLPEYDQEFAARYAQASARDHVLRYIGRLAADGSASVGLEELPRDHAFAHINLTDNIVQFETARYCDNPLIVQGPGAGPAVTAAGVFADLLRLAGYLGAAI